MSMQNSENIILDIRLIRGYFQGKKALCDLGYENTVSCAIKNLIFIRKSEGETDARHNKPAA